MTPTGVGGAPPSSRWALALAGAVCWTLGCSPVEDGVFEMVALSLAAEPVSVAENAGLISIPLRLNRPATAPILLDYRAVELGAQSGCQTPDFQSAAGTLVWEAGQSEAVAELWVEDDRLAETDERLKLVFSSATGLQLPEPAELIIEIEDDDRTALLEASSFGLQPNQAFDQSAALQRALDASGQSGRGVVVLAPGNYEITGVVVPAGTTLSGAGAALYRPADAPVRAQTLTLEHAAASDSMPTLIEKLGLNGRRERQGAYRGYEREHAHLIAVRGDPASAGRALLTLESVSVNESTGDGINLNTNVDATLCRVQGNDLWRDMLSVRGGATRVRLRDVDVSATSGTSGLWFDVGTRGYGGTRRLDVELEDVRLESGDVELDVRDGSRVTVQRLVMTKAPFRLVALESSVSIADSVITTGIRSNAHNYWGPFLDVQLRNTTLRVSENDSEGTEEVTVPTTEAQRQLATVLIDWTSVDVSPPAPPGRISFDACRFELAGDIEADDSVYAVDSPGAEASVRVTSGALGPSFAGWFAPGCPDCQRAP